MSDDAAPATRRRLRAKQACTACHSRRIRCNVTEACPCFNCLTTGSTCEVVPSMRGRHKRRPRHPSKTQAPPAQPELTPGRASESAMEDTPNNASVSARTQISGQHRSPVPPPLPGRRDTIAQTPVSDTGTTSSNLIHGGMFFGESNALTCVAGEELEPAIPTCKGTRQEPRYYPVPQDPVAASPEDDRDLRERVLRQQGALDLPTQEQYTPVLQAYFRWFHPCFPIIDKVEFGNMYLKNQIPPLLLNGMLFVGVTHCEEKAVRNLGYSSLGEAKSKLYNKTKLLFEADWETNSLVVLQALFLLTFLRVPMSTVKGHRYWLSAAINLAHLHGLHRASSGSSSAVSAQAKLRRRIWWSLYYRDIHSSISLGLPARVREEDCDVPMLTPSDLLDDTTPAVSWLADPPSREQVVYVVNMPRLMCLLSRIVNRFFAPKPSPKELLSSQQDFMDLIEKWKMDLPADMQEVTEGGEPLNMWTCLLHLAYNHLIILLYRDDFMNHRPCGQNAISAARRVTRIAEEVLAEGTIKYSQLYLITSVFAALCIHTIHLQHSQGVARRLGENRAKICLLALKEAQKSWNINNDILDLFFQHVEARLASEFQKEVADYAQDGGNTSSNNLNNHTAAGMLLGMPQLPTYEGTAQGQEGVMAVFNSFNVLGSQTEDFMPFFTPGIDFSLGDDMGTREFDSLQRWF